MSDDIERRSLLGMLPRLTVLGGLGAFGAWLGHKRATADHTCINDSYCKACVRIDKGCILPQAMSYRQVHGLDEENPS